MIEEIGKGAVLLAVAHQVHHREPRDGMVLGAVVGAGFAAFESAGYALQTMLDNLDEQPSIDILEIEAFRAVLAPFGHITWTALLGGALFASSRGGRFHVTRRLVLTFLGVVTLHALWDQSYGWAIRSPRASSGDGWHLVWPNAETWVISPTSEALVWFNVFYNGLLAANALVGAVWIVHSWRTYGRWGAQGLTSQPPAPSPRRSGRPTMACSAGSGNVLRQRLAEQPPLELDARPGRPRRPPRAGGRRARAGAGRPAPSRRRSGGSR